MMNYFKTCCFTFATLIFLQPAITTDAQPLKIFVSVDMEGIGGIGTRKMTQSTGKDYATGRELMTAEVNTVVEALFASGVSEVLVNDSHGDMQNLLHRQLDDRVEYIQGNIKPSGMVEGLDGSFDGVIYLGYHARAGTDNGFLAHTGSGAVKGLWLNGVEVGEGGANAYLAGSYGVPVILASGDATFTKQFNALVPTRTVSTKEPVGSLVAKLKHPSVVRSALRSETAAAIADLKNNEGASAIDVSGNVTVRMRFATTTRADILQAIPGMTRVDGVTVEYVARDMPEAYKLIRLMYKYVSW